MEFSLLYVAPSLLAVYVVYYILQQILECQASSAFLTTRRVLRQDRSIVATDVDMDAYCLQNVPKGGPWELIE